MDKGSARTAFVCGLVSPKAVSNVFLKRDNSFGIPARRKGIGFIFPNFTMDNSSSAMGLEIGGNANEPLDVKDCSGLSSLFKLTSLINKDHEINLFGAVVFCSE